MNHSLAFFLLVLAPALALVLGVLGLETLEKNILGWLDFAIGVGYPSSAIIHFWNRRNPFRRHNDGREMPAEAYGDRSLWLILPGLIITLYAPALEYLYLPTYLPRTVLMQYAGMVLIVLGAAWSYWARATLKEKYPSHVQRTVRQHLVKKGPYAFVRHPGYTGFLLMTLGLCLGYSSVIGLVAIPILLLPAFIYRINLEEKLLALSIGDEYRAYSRDTKRILPGIW